MSQLQEVQKQVDAIEDGRIKAQISDGYHTFDELYEFRKQFNAALFNLWAQGGMYNVHKSTRHNDGEDCFGGGWFIVVAVLPLGQISNHYRMQDWDLFRIPEAYKAIFPFDGHTGHDVLERLKDLNSNYTFDQPISAPFK